MSKQNQMTAQSEAPAKNANTGEHWGTGSGGLWSHMLWNSGRPQLLSLASQPSFVLVGYQAREHGSRLYYS